MTTEYVKVVFEKMSSVIYPQITQLINLYSIKYVDTGDRVKDGAFIMILNCTIGIALSGLYHILKYIYQNHLTNIIYGIKRCNQYEIDVVEVIKLQKREDMYSTHKHIFQFDNNDDIVMEKFPQFILKYSIDNNIIGDITTSSLIIYGMSELNTHGKGAKRKKYESHIKMSSIYNIFVPVKRYFDIHTHTYEYIFLDGCSLRSKSSIELTRYLEHITTEKQKSIEQLCGIDQHTIYNLDIVNEKSYDRVMVGHVKPIQFDHIYFNEKPVLMEWLDKFKKDTLYPAKLCMSNKIGILLYGPHGTGKTGCISALANCLQRDIININALNICNMEQTQFAACFREHKDTSIFVFDEFDYLLSDQSMEAVSDTHTVRMDDTKNMLLFAKDDIERKEILETMRTQRKPKNGKMDVCFLMKLLDGIGDDNGRIIIATTNHPEKIPPQFLRPGRFDLKLELGYCTYTMFVDIVSTKYENVLEYIDEAHINELLLTQITPVILINNLVTSTNFVHLLELLQTKEESDV
jgi:SpoVK/Ycf46/Vps4 family AAA+-type ATPase